ncbi:MAG: AtpZ/AtpI family protein [Myxococcales bacterium]|nr:AtpZ/AtpI family protein [Polyangiaceae bacterium]MDW8249243.1 AtpZ/AtpI family protein [Myxococcales bacterium]
MSSPNKLLLQYGSVGIEFALSVLLGLLAGRWADQRAGTGGGLVLAGFLLGVLLGFRSLWRVTQQAQREIERGSSPNDDQKPCP